MTGLYTGSAPTVKTSQMLLIREALVQKIVCMGTDEKRRLGLDELQTCIFDIVVERSTGRTRWRTSRPRWRAGRTGASALLRGEDQVVLLQGRGRAAHGESKYDEECGLCAGWGLREPRPKVRPRTVLGPTGAVVDVASTSGKVRRGADDGPAPADVLRPGPGLRTPGFVCPKGGHQAATDIVVGEESTEKDRQRNNLLVGLHPMDGVGTAPREAPPPERGREANPKSSPSDERFSLSSPEGVQSGTRSRRSSAGSERVLGNTYVGNYCMCYVDRATKERTVYIVNIAGQGAGRCPNALHCECGLRREACKKPGCLSAWGVHREQKSPMYVHIEKKAPGATTLPCGAGRPRSG